MTDTAAAVTPMPASGRRVLGRWTLALAPARETKRYVVLTDRIAENTLIVERDGEVYLAKFFNTEGATRLTIQIMVE